MMYDVWIAVIIGIVEGLTEFLPISSTGHMILTGHLLGVSDEDNIMKTFEIFIQLGAILAVVVLYWRRVLRLFGRQSAAEAAAGAGGGGAADSRGINLIHIFIAIAPALVLAYLFRDVIKGVLFSPYTVLIGLVLGGIFLIVAEKQRPVMTAETMEDLTYKQTLFIGLAQILSLWPGFSRSGATIAGGLLAGASRSAAADFTFLIAIPVMIAASGYEMLQSYTYITAELTVFFAAGFIVSFVVALLAVLIFIQLVARLSLVYFAYYRFILAALFACYMFVTGME